jgi:phosphatidylglycerophosphate synthase
MLFTKEQQEALKNHKYSTNDNSLSGQYLWPFWVYLQKFVPPYIAPNVISFLGFFCTFLALLVVGLFHDIYPITSEILSTLLIFIYINLDCIDGIHARANNNASPMGEFIDHACDSISAIFISLTACYVFSVNKELIIWLITQIVLLNFIMCHLEAYVKGEVYFSRFFGPTEVLLYYCTIVCLKIFNIDIIGELYLNIFVELYVLIFLFVSYRVILYTKNEISKKNTKMAIYICATILTSLFAGKTNTTEICMGCLPLSVLASDIILCKMTKKTTSMIVPIVAIVSIYNLYISTIIIIAYYYFVLKEMSETLEIFIFKMNKPK